MPNSNETVPQSAVIAYRRIGEGIEILLVTSLDTGRWVLPKGHLYGKMSARVSAEKEAFEEGGIKGTVAKQCVGAYTYDKRELKENCARRVKVYPMEVSEVLEDWPEKAHRQRQWMTPKQAAEAVDEAKLGKILLSFSKSVCAKQ